MLVFNSILTLTSLGLLAVNPITSVAPIATASPAIQVSPEVQNIRQVVKQKVQETINEISSLTSNKRRAWKGIVTQSDLLEITIVTQKDATRTIKLTDNTVFIDSSRQKIDPTKIKVGQEILAMGDTENETTLVGKRIVLIGQPDPAVAGQSLIFGKLNDYSKTTNLGIIIQLSNKTELTFAIDSKTKYFDIDKLALDSKILVKNRNFAVLLANPQLASKSKPAVASTIILLDSAPSPTPSIAKP